eukprot:COSAG03_NODE_1928_length_3349_cov_1.712308_2_plen_81_part_00
MAKPHHAQRWQLVFDFGALACLCVRKAGAVDVQNAMVSKTKPKMEMNRPSNHQLDACVLRASHRVMKTSRSPFIMGARAA